MLKLRAYFAMVLSKDGPLEDLMEAEAIHDDVVRIARRVFGADHPDTAHFQHDLVAARAKLAHARA